MQLAHRVRHSFCRVGSEPRLHEGAIEAKVDLRESRDGCEFAVVSGIVAAVGPNVVKRSRLEADELIALDQIVGLFGIAPRSYDGFVKARRQYVDQIDIARKLIVLLASYRSRNEDTKMADGFMNCVDDRLTMGANIIDRAVEIQDPAERLLRGCNVVGLRAKDEDG